MYDNLENIKMIIEILKENSIKDIVISPGGTNAKFISMIQNDTFFNCYSVVDERSAAYFAIGIYLQKRQPVCLLCTSAQATRNYLPGLTEAYYKKVPILAITMEKHPRFKYQGYMQAPDQTSLPNDSVKKSFELPFISDINDVYHSRRLINEAVLELTRNGNGPVQLCIPWLDFKISDIYPSEISIERYKSLKGINLSNKKILIIIGEHSPFSNELRNAINNFCNNTNSVIYTNHLSNFSNNYSINGNLLLSCINDKDFDLIRPDIVISIGGQTGDYPLYTRLSKTEYNFENWIISEDGKIQDTYDKLTKVFECSEIEFFSNVEASCTEHAYYEEWNRLNTELDRDIEVPFSNVSIASYLHDKLPKDSIVQFSILNSLRIWNLFELNDNIECYSNVGAFGIDGGMSTLVGQSIVTNKLCFMIIGDLAFFYDMNILGNRHIKNNLRILLINNDGGIEFKLHGENKNVVDRYIAAEGHYKNAKGWAISCGFEYIEANSMERFKENVKKFISESDKPIVFEVFVKDVNEALAYKALIENNKKYTKNEKFKGLIKSTIKSTIGENNFNKLKEKIKERKI